MAIDKSKTDLIKAKYEELTGTLSDPAVASRPEEYTKYSKELASLNPQVEAIRNYEACEKEIEGIITLLESGDLGGDDEMRSLANAELAGADQTVYKLKIKITPGEENKGTLTYTIYGSKDIRYYDSKTIDDYDYRSGGQVILISDYR